MADTATQTATSTETQTTTTPTITSTATVTSTPTATATATPPAGIANYYYDGNGTMVKSVIDNIITYYPSSSYQVKTDGTHTNTRKYYSFSGVVVAMSENGNVTWLLQDQVSSTTITANADGSLASEVRYSAFGEIRASTGTTVTDKKYTGQQQESEIGLDYYVARFYDPTIAHFVQPDSTIPESGSSKAFDRYSYVNNSPINFNDPTGKDPCNPRDPGFNIQNCQSAAADSMYGATKMHTAPSSNPNPAPRIPEKATTPTKTTSGSIVVNGFSIPLFQGSNVNLKYSTSEENSSGKKPQNTDKKLISLIKDDIAQTIGYFNDSIMAYSIYPSTSPSAFSLSLNTPYQGSDDYVIPYANITVKEALTILATTLDLSVQKSSVFNSMIDPINLNDGFNFTDWISAYSAMKYWDN
jgi:RHS repeat-associated protein